ncbi:MAG: glycosyltransferase family 2 protein [Hyphococcus sp.]
MADEKLRAGRLGVVIVNYRTPALTERCLDALAPMLAAADAVAIVVDNASGDGSYERLLAYCQSQPARDRLMVTAAPANGGFSAGNNVGIALLDTDYVLLLNSDAIAKPGALSALLAVAEASPDAGMITPKIIGADGAEAVSRFRNHSLLGELLDGAQTGPVTGLFPWAETPIYPGDWATRPDWVSFAAVMIKRAAADRAGPMDEGFFLYYEDCDYSRRIRSLGYDIATAPDAVFVHEPGGTTGLRESEAARARLPAYYYASRSRYFRKYYGPAGALLANAAWLAGRAIARLRAIVGRPAPAVCEQRGRDIWIGWRGGAAAKSAER